MKLEFRLDIESSAGVKFGSGPIASATDWEYTARFDVAGTFRFRMLASDPQRAIVQNRRVARAYARIDGVWTEVGAGVIDSIRLAPSANGMVMLEVSGLDLIYELAYRSVGKLKIGEGSGATHAQGVTAIDAFAPANWTLTAAVSPDHDYIYGRYGGESVLGACCYLAEATQTHFYRGQGRELIFTSQFTDSGIRAIKADGDLSSETCGITSLDQQVDTYDLLTRIYPEGNGQGEAMLTLAATTRAAPAGYTLNAAENYIQHDAAYAEHGLVDFPRVAYKSIGPISNTDADLEAAANMLFDNALHELERRATLAEQRTYTLALTQCGVLLRPLQTIPVIYRDLDQGVDIDEELYILESTWSVGAAGIQATRVVVSTDDRWPDNDESLANEQATKGQVFQAHPQLNANSYVVVYTKNLDQDNDAAFRFRFGLEVTQLQQVLFEFLILPFETTVRSVGGATSGSGDLSTTSPNINDTGSGGNNDTGSTTPTINAATPTIGTTTPTIGTTTPTIGTTTPTIGGNTLETNEPEGGDIESGGQHGHALTIHDVFSGAGLATVYFEDGSPPRLSAVLGGASEFVTVNLSGTHTHEIGNHTHTIDSHTHTITGHTHTIGAHTHTIDGHTHTMPSHTHTMSAHTHSLNNHIHDLSEALALRYGIVRDTMDLDISRLQYRVNGGIWTGVAGNAEDAGDGWYALDITADVYASTTYRPLQPNNMLEMRVAPVPSVDIDSWSAAGGTVVITTSDTISFQVDDNVLIAGAATGGSGGIINGETVINNNPIGGFIPVDDHNSVGTQSGGAGGTVSLLYRATIDAQLSVRNTIQAIAYL